MKKRIFSAMMALCLAFSISGTAFATEVTSSVTSGAGTPASQTVNNTATGTGDEKESDTNGQPVEEPSESSSESTLSSSEDGQEEDEVSSETSSSSVASSASSAASDSASDNSSDEDSGTTTTDNASEETVSSEEQQVPADEDEIPGSANTAIQPSETESDIGSEIAPLNISPNSVTDNGNGTYAYGGLTVHHGLDTSEDITINLFDYQTAMNTLSQGGFPFYNYYISEWNVNDPVKSSINFSGDNRNSARPFLFLYDPGDENVYSNNGNAGFTSGGNGRNNYTGSINSGIVQDTLGDDGYPVLSGTNGTSLNYLFDPDLSVNGRTDYENANYLFTDDNGAYSYDSSTTFASLVPALAGENGNNFWLYDTASTVEVQNISNTRYTTSTPRFMPFNSLIRNGNSLSYADGEQANYHFGMTVEFNFIMPEDGMFNGQEMEFSFTGDDDVWVFVDDKLVLDLGGIHPSQKGTINFATGGLTNGTESNLEDILGDGWDTEYSVHTLKFFYLERGAGDSNCQLRFNMPTIPSDSVAVTKRVTGDAPDNASYTMQFAAQDTNFDYSQITWNVSGGEPQSLGENKTFTVNAGQTVYVNGIPDNTQYQIHELDIASDVIGVTINGKDKTPAQGSTSASSDVLTSGNNDAVIVTNTYPVQPPEGFGITTGKTAIRDTDDPSQYELSLSMTGDRDQDEPGATPVDILFIVDRSGSMTERIGEYDRTTRIAAVQTAVQTLVNSVEAQGNLLDPRYNVVAFSRKNASRGYPGTETITNGWVSSGDSVISAVKSMRTGGGTNWEAAIQAGNQQLQSIIQQNEQSGRDAEQIVIFLSDGVPTFYGNDRGEGSDDDMTEDEIKDYKDQAVDDVAVMPCDRFYAIGVGPDFDSNSDIGYICMDDLRNQAKNATQTNIFAATESDALNNIFSDIAESLSFFSCVDVVMTDQLSPWADLSQEQGSVTFTVQLERYDSTAQNYVVIGSQTVNAGASATFNANDTAYSDYLEKTVVITPSVTYPEGEQPIITAAITGANGTEYEIEPGLRYTVKTMITPSQLAIDTFEDDGEAAYTATGEANTGTHAGDEGYLSNNESNAQVSYNVKVTTDGVTSKLPGTEPFPKPVIQVDSSLIRATSAELTLSKTFVGLTDEDVYFLLFGQYTLPENPTDKDLNDYYEANFSFDINFCDYNQRDVSGDSGWMAEGVNDSDSLLHEQVGNYVIPGTNNTELTSGGDFKVYAARCLEDPGSAELLAQENVDENGDLISSLQKDSNGNWVYTQVVTIPVTPEDKAVDDNGQIVKDENGNDIYRYFYTVYELHGELPGYAKLDPDSVEYTVNLNEISEGTYSATWSGRGKFVQTLDMADENDDGKIDRDEALINMIDEDEQNSIPNWDLGRLHITGNTSISFSNYYTDSLSIQKNVTLDNDETADTAELFTELGNKEYTIKIEPADESKLVTSSSTDEKNGLGPDWASKLAGTPITVLREGTNRHSETETVTFNEDGEIILELYRGEKITLKDIPAINYSITEIVPENEDSTFYDTENYYLADTYFTEVYDGKVDNGPIDDQYGTGENCTKPNKDNQGPDHWNQYGAEDPYGYSDVGAGAKNQDGVVSVDVEMGSTKTSVDVTLTNDYEHFKTVTITKQVGGELGAKDAAFDFTTNVERQDGSVLYENNVKNGTAQGGDMTLSGTGTSTEVVDVEIGNSDQAILTSDGYQLSHDDVLTIGKLKKGDTITIVEKDANRNGYDTTYTINGAADKKPYGSNISVTLDDTTLAAAGDDNEIPVVVYNDQPIVTPTGLESSHTKPYTLMVTSAGIAGLALIGAIVNRRIRRRREE